jgi:cyclopropane-fatty-acyl-phospholipid synthase
MNDMAASAPSNYVEPRGRLERALCRRLCRAMISSERIAVAIDSDDKAVAKAEFVLVPPRLWTLVRIFVTPTFWVGESYVTGSWYLRKGRLTDFLDVIRSEAPPVFRCYYEFVAGLRGVRHYLAQYLLNTHYTRKVRRHYEVDSKIYEMILDREMVYTCAFFEQASQSLDDAQQHKLAVAISRLQLSQGPVSVLDIGCGWGATARALVQSHPRAQVCGLSISKGQIAWAKNRDLAVLPSDQLCRIEYRVEDYVDHRETESYDAVVVIGMIEHVGLGGYDTFFRRVYDF